MAAQYGARLLWVVAEPFTAPPPELIIIPFVLALDALELRGGAEPMPARRAWPVRGIACAALLLLAYVMSSGDNRAFIYFQF